MGRSVHRGPWGRILAREGRGPRGEKAYDARAEPHRTPGEGDREKLVMAKTEAGKPVYETERSGGHQGTG